MSNTESLRKIIDKLDSVLQWLINLFPIFYFNKKLNCLSVDFYDCSFVAKHYLTKTHLLDLHFNQYPKIKWLSLCGFTIWFPYTWEEIKEKTCCKLPGNHIDEYIQLNKSINKELKAIKKEAIDLIHYADTCAKILKENGYDVKAKTLESKYVKLGRRFGLKPKSELPPETNTHQDNLEEEPK